MHQSTRRRSRRTTYSGSYCRTAASDGTEHRTASSTNGTPTQCALPGGAHIGTTTQSDQANTNQQGLCPVLMLAIFKN